MEPVKKDYRLIDFAGLPMQEAANVLRRLAMSLLSELLKADRSLDKTKKNMQPPYLLKYLSSEEIRALAKSAVWKVIRKGPLKRIPRYIRENPQRALKKLVKKTVAGKIKPRQFQVAANNRIALALGGTAGSGLPDALWSIAAEMAWNDARFKLSVSMKLYEWLRNIRLLAPYEPFVPLISANTFWVLISLAMVKPPKTNRWLSADARARVRLGKHLQEEARVRILSNEWAGFWDQWIIRMASQCWPAGFKQLDTRLCKALAALPLLNIQADSALFGGMGRSNPLIGIMVEKWFDKIDGVRRLRRPSKDFRRAVLLNLSAPDWKTDMPGFLKDWKTETVTIIK
jgi:hypothetical protein